jgi:hypothetical protein
VPSTQRFVLRQDWQALAASRALTDWRRLVAVNMLVHRCLAHPCSLDEFVHAVLTPLGLDASQMIDMSRAQLVPVARQEGRAIRMVRLPLTTPVGPPAVYLAVRHTTGMIEEAALYPAIHDPEARSTA